jgi:protein-S-isoprenylcysteine O-methyltransferase Ste14
MMRTAILGLALANLALIGLLPRIFFRPGRLNLNWWLTASPFLLAAALLLAALIGALAPAAPGGDLFPPAVAAFALVGSVSSIALIGLTIAAHSEPLSLWHQADDAPRSLVTGGPYTRVRHPFYLAFILGMIGVAAALPHWTTAALLLAAAAQLNRTARREERRLLDSAFGAEYARYMRRTGRFLPALRRGSEMLRRDAGLRPSAPTDRTRAAGRNGAVR